MDNGYGNLSDLGNFWQFKYSFKKWAILEIRSVLESWAVFMEIFKNFSNLIKSQRTERDEVRGQNVQKF